MNASESQASGTERPDGKRAGSGFARGVIQVTIFMLVMGVVLFISAGRLDWGAAWVYIAVAAINTAVLIWLLDPELIAERAGFQEGAKRWDIPLALILGRIGPLAALIVAGLDVRNGWSPQIASVVKVVAWATGVLALLLTDWAMLSNRFFAGLVRIQKDRGHVVVSTGPYRYLRHPGYAGSIVWALATPLMLGSLWTFIPAALTTCATVIRTALEDRTLRRELDGYQDYVQRVRYRLLPGLW